MAEGTYEYECMRAELLGLKTPDQEEFEFNRGARMEVLEDEMDTINLEDAETHNEQYSKIGGKLNELNSILRNTQQKINNFKTYGFVTTAVSTLFKLKKDRDIENTENAHETTDNNATSATSTYNEETREKNGENSTENPAEHSRNGISTPSNTPVKKGDLSKALDKQTDILDRLLEKSENAQYSMMNQRKEMKNFLK